MSDLRRRIHGEPSHMRRVQYTLFIRKLQRSVTFPGKMSRLRHTPYLFAFLWSFSPVLSSCKLHCIRILYNFSVDLVIIFICICWKLTDANCTDISKPHLFCKRNLLLNLGRAFFIQQQTAIPIFRYCSGKIQIPLKPRDTQAFRFSRSNIHVQCPLYLLFSVVDI